MAATRRAYTGGAQSTTTTSNIASSGTTSFTITAYTGWPYGSDPFHVVVEPGTASEEKILVTRSGSTDTTINIASDSERGQDGTSAVAHSSGSTVFPVFTALDADEANELTSSWSTKGDLVSYGSSTFETLGVGSDDTVLIADSGEASGLKWGSVGTDQLADGGVTAAKLATGANKLGSGTAVAPGDFSSGDVLTAADMNGLPAGIVAYGMTTAADYTLTSTPQTVATHTITTSSSRLYLVTCSALCFSIGTTIAQAEIDIGGATKHVSQIEGDGTIDRGMFVHQLAIAGTDSSEVWNWKAFVNSGTATFSNSGGRSSYFQIIDVGPA